MGVREVEIETGMVDNKESSPCGGGGIHALAWMEGFEADRPNPQVGILRRKYCYRKVVLLGSRK